VSRYVVKLGGHALDSLSPNSALLATLADDVRALRGQGVDVVIVHGGGPQIERDLATAGIVVEVVDGFRVTTAQSVGIVAAALVRVNGEIVAALAAHGVGARSVLGRRGLLHARPLGGAWGRVGTDIRVDIEHLALDSGGVPVVDPIATDADGELLNCNADSVAGAIACALGADALILLSDVSQVRADPDDPATALTSLSRAQAADLQARGGAVGGMIPKLAAAVAAVDAGARRVVITDARGDGALAHALAGTGTFTEVHA
jgi:acetylglutamate kinase